MISKDVNISIPVLWSDKNFIKNDWGTINYIVGPNGTGKSLLAEQLKVNFSNSGFNARYLNAERLTGLEKQPVTYFGGASLNSGFDISSFSSYKQYAENSGLSSSGIIILKERLDIRLKIEALLSDIFGKTIRLVEEGGYLKAKMQNHRIGTEYNLNNSECHGLKELITLLSFLYDPSKNCLIFDEPELHLHPQFQSFFLEEIRKVAGNPLVDPSKKMFFIITHSPYFLDFKSLDDLKNILVCHNNEVPSYISSIEETDQNVLRKFLPRFNTHHKQFFFSPNPVFVEGYTDQQIISLLFEKYGVNIGASGSCIIDVGGKDELAVFYRLCKALKINCRIIADLDALFRGRLRRVISEDECSKVFLQQEGVGSDVSQEIGNLENKLSLIGTKVVESTSPLPSLLSLKSKLQTLTNEEIHTKRVSILLGIFNHQNDIKSILDQSGIDIVNFILGRVSKLFAAFKSCNTYIIPKGEIEHYYIQTQINYLNITNKDSWFHKERDFILQLQNKDEVISNYPELFTLIQEAVPTVQVEMRRHLKFEIVEWIQKVQTCIAKEEIKNQDDLIRHAKINYTLYNQILDLMDLTIYDNKKFTCSISIKKTLLEEEIKVVFNQNTNAHEFDF